MAGVFPLLFGILCVLLLSEGRSIDEGKSNRDEKWQPETGTKEEWMRCHGYSCSDWANVKEKLAYLKILATARDSIAFDLVNEEDLTDDSLDGCIWLTPEQLDEMIEKLILERSPEGSGRKKRQLNTHAFALWSMPVVYKFDGDHSESEKATIRGGFQHWMDNTCVTFREIGTSEAYSDNHVLITRANSGCHSFVGRIRSKPQQLNLQSACVQQFGTIAHEIGHALGLWHEQQRDDRDDYVDVLWGNVRLRSQFLKQTTLSHGVQYDYGSVMHYAQYSGTRNGDVTLLARDRIMQASMGQRTGLSFSDIKIINKAYCQDVCTRPLEKQCQYGGYQDPVNCNQCRCPDGLTGTYCQDVVSGSCSGLIHVRSSDPEPKLIASPGYGSPGFYNNYDECSWKIVAPAGQNIQLRFVGDFFVYCHYSGECFHWVEVKYKDEQVNKAVQGPRFCCNGTPREVLESEGEEMIVTFRANWTSYFQRSRKGFLASVTAIGEPPKVGVIWHCSFEDPEDPLCSMEQSTTDDFDWTRQKGKTPSQITGPSSAVNGSYYVFIEASNPRKRGDKAVLTVPALEVEHHYCLKFKYHMFGHHINRLSVVIGSVGETRTVWEQQGEKGDMWLDGNVTVNMGADVSLSFVAERGGEYSGDIALDDISLSTGECS